MATENLPPLLKSLNIFNTFAAHTVERKLCHLLVKADLLAWRSASFEVRNRCRFGLGQHSASKNVLFSKKQSFLKQCQFHVKHVDSSIPNPQIITHSRQIAQSSQAANLIISTWNRVSGSLPCPMVEDFGRNKPNIVWFQIVSMFQLSTK